MFESLARAPVWLRRLGAVIAAGVLTFVLCALAPLRAQGGDTVPGRLGGVALACLGTHDLARIQWVALPATRGALPYWVNIGGDGSKLVSTFGPGPAWAAAPAMRGLEPGQTVTDRELQERARMASAILLAVSASLLCLGLLAFAAPAVAAVATLVPVLSFAGAPTLGQALWQQTVALPWIMAAVAALAWSEQSPRWGIVVPGCLGVAVLLRPPEVGLVVVLGIAWLVTAHRARSSLPMLVSAIGLTALLASPLIFWNLAYHDRVLPAGQWQTNVVLARGHDVFDLSPAHLVEGLLGLLVSPARGILWYAPVVVIACAAAWRAGGVLRWVAGAVLAEWCVAAAFYKWWGGSAFGPRLLSIAVWVAALGAGALWTDASRRLRAWVILGSAVTSVVGLVGLARYDLQLWDQVRKPDLDPAVLWGVEGSPLVLLFSGAEPESPLVDAPTGPFVYCPEQGHWALVGVPEIMWRQYGPGGGP